MQLALEVWGADHRQMLSTCRRAEELGFDAFYVGESPTGLNLDCWTTLAALAQATDTIRLGPVITNVLPTYRTTLLLGRQAATVAVVAEGRLDFRTGVGAAVAYGRSWWRPFGVEYGTYPERAADLDTALGLLKPFWAGRPVTLGDAGISDAAIGDAAIGDAAIGDAAIGEGGRGDAAIGEAVSLGFEAPPIPVTVAAVGPTGLELAARHAEVWESSFRTPTEFESLDADFRRRLDEVGSAATEPVRRSLEIDAVVGTDDRRAAATLDTLRRDRAGEDLDRLLERALVGRPEQVAERLVALSAVGVDQVVIAAHNPHDPDALVALARGRELAEV